MNNTPYNGIISVHFPLQKSDRGFGDRLQKAHFIARILISFSEFCFLFLCTKGENGRCGVQMGVSGVKSVSLHVGFDVMCVTGAPRAHTRSDEIKSTK